jgi:hypothetical protein
LPVARRRAGELSARRCARFCILAQEDHPKITDAGNALSPCFNRCNGGGKTSQRHRRAAAEEESAARRPGTSFSCVTELLCKKNFETGIEYQQTNRYALQQLVYIAMKLFL